MTIIMPRRLTPPDPPGSRLKNFQPKPKIIWPERDNDPAYLEKIRACPCLHCGTDPCGEAAHLRMASAAHGKSSGLGKKPADRWALPLDPSCHRINRDAQHNRSEREFWAMLGIDAPQTAVRLYAQRHDLVAMRAVVMVAIADRTKR
jgi:hypothetical protein